MYRYFKENSQPIVDILKETVNHCYVFLIGTKSKKNYSMILEREAGTLPNKILLCACKRQSLQTYYTCDSR